MLLYIVVWAIAFLLPLTSQVFDYLSGSQRFIDYTVLMKRFLQTLPYFIVFAVNNFVLNPIVLRRGNHVLYFICVGALLFGLWLYSGLTFQLPSAETLSRLYLGDFIMFDYMSNPLDLSRVTTVIIGFCIIQTNEMIKNYIMSMRKDQLMLQIRAEHTMTELNALKYQLDPHFLMNALNSVQALVYIDQERASHAIQLLSRLMRHLLYDSSNSVIALAKEIGFMKDLIELLKLKLPANARIITEFPTVDAHYKIPPRLFTPYIENAFKYGGGIEDTYVNVSISIDDGRLHFKCVNKISHPVADNPSGIGLKNASRRFDLLYDNNYDLTITNGDDLFIVDVVIPIAYNKH